MKQFLLIILLSVSFVYSKAQQKTIYKFDIKQNIGSVAWIHTQEAFKEARRIKADAMLLHLNTYGGQLVFADSIRTTILNCKIPVYVFIDNNAASAGALISIACDSIYMRPGANIGAATVVNQSGEKMPDKYQSYMRSTIRATAEAHGKDTLINNGDTTYVWHRDPKIAEAMVDESVTIKGIIASDKILTFTTQEAIKYGFCEAEVNSVNDILKRLGHNNYKLIEHKYSIYGSIKGFMINPVLHGILILIIIGGLYFELQSPGIGFPLIISIIAAILYFAPLYIDGLAANWEILLFIAGVILIALEIFVIPGFGITGVTGIILVFAGLSLSLLNNVAFDFSNVSYNDAVKALIIVSSGTIFAFIIAIPLSAKLFTTGPFAKVSLQTTQKISEGYLSVDASLSKLINETGIAQTTLRPSGKILINDNLYDAISVIGMIEKGSHIKVIKFESGQLYVLKTDNSHNA